MNLLYASGIALALFAAVCFLSNGMDASREDHMSSAVLSKLMADAIMYKSVAAGQNSRVALVFMAKAYGLLSASLHVAQYTNSGDTSNILDDMKEIEDELEAYSQF